MNNSLTLLTALLLIPLSLLRAAPAAFDVVWTSPSRDSLDSMPLSGARGAGANVWLQDGSLWLYLAHNGAYDARGRLLKLDCLRITPPGGGFDPATVRQQLDLARGQILISGRTTSGTAVSATVWFTGENLLVESSDRLPDVWEIDFATRSGSLEIDLGEEKEIGSFLVSEIEWKETREFTIEVKQGDAWKEVARGTNIGKDKDIPVAPVKTRLIRLNVLQAANAININEFQAFPPTH